MLISLAAIPAAPETRGVLKLLFFSAFGCSSRKLTVASLRARFVDTSGNDPPATGDRLFQRRIPRLEGYRS